ncbi:hypothetical protein BSPA111_32620 [Buttiauxella sp. A111]|nr:hypothetical protein BSPA111_32620 [Buttiauxella sp. A111]
MKERKEMVNAAQTLLLKSLTRPRAPLVPNFILLSETIVLLDNLNLHIVKTFKKHAKIRMEK